MIRCDVDGDSSLAVATRHGMGLNRPSHVYDKVVDHKDVWTEHRPTMPIVNVATLSDGVLWLPSYHKIEIIER